MLALSAYLWALLQVWPDKPLRWAIPVFVTWLVPPTLMLWLTMMPMGHYMESWFFHALSLPALVLILSDRASPPRLVAIGAAAGVATVYTVSNVIFGVLLGIAWLLFGKGGLKARLIGAASLIGGFLLTWGPLIGTRLGAVAGRVGDSMNEEKGSVVLVALRFLRNLAKLPTPEVVVDGTTWARRGLFAVLEQVDMSLATAAAYVLATVGLLGVCYLFRWAGALVLPRHRSALDLPQKFMAMQAVLLVMTLGAYATILQDQHTFVVVNYLVISYPVVLLGLSVGIARWMEGPGRGHKVRLGTGVGLLLLLVVGWAQTSAWALRSVDRPDIGAPEYLTVTGMYRISEEGTPPGSPAAAAAARFEERCNQAHPSNVAFCSAAAWELTAFHRGWDGSLEEGFCADAPPDRKMACGLAVGAYHYTPLIHPSVPEGAPVGAPALCRERAPDAPQACLTGAYRTGTVDSYTDLRWGLSRVISLCNNGGLASGWTLRACDEATAALLTGMPPLPPSTAAMAKGPCSSWPQDLRGLCGRLASARQAEPDEVSCEQIYLERYASEIPAENSLIFQQCQHVNLLAPHPRLYAPCAIGVARALDGVTCSWAGTELRQ